ncbi:unnamed protein product, partial [Ectocarpus sp. 12 AP-2014]
MDVGSPNVMMISRFDCGLRCAVFCCEGAACTLLPGITVLFAPNNRCSRMLLGQSIVGYWVQKLFALFDVFLLRGSIRFMRLCTSVVGLENVRVVEALGVV